MPLYEEKFLSPFAIRFSQARIRPTFQDGRLVDRSMSQVEAVPWPLEDDGDYDVFLSAPFPPIEIIRWRPKIREEDGRTCVDEDGRKMLGEACWFTFDNRRLYCLQAAASKQWPRRAGAIVHIMHDLPLSKSTPRKFRTTDLGCSVRISWRHNVAPRATWCWAEATRSGASDVAQQSEEGRIASDAVHTDASQEDWSELSEVPYDIVQRSSHLTPLEPCNPQALAQGIIANGNASQGSGAYEEEDEGDAAPPPRRREAREAQHWNSGYGSAAHGAAAAAASSRRAAPGSNSGAAAAAAANMADPSLAWPNQQVNPMGLNGFNGFNGASSNALTVSALAAQFAQAQAQAQVRARQDPTVLAGGKANGSLFSQGVTPAMALAMTAPLMPAAGPSCNNGSLLGTPSQFSSSTTGPLLSGTQMLPVSSTLDDDDDEENCVQS